MNDIVLLAQHESGTFPARQATFDQFGPGGCETVTPSTRWTTQGWGWDDVDASLLIELSPVAADFRAERDDFTAHRFLHEAVTYAYLEYGFSPGGISVALRVEGHDDVLFFRFEVLNQPQGSPDDVDFVQESPANRYEWMGFEIANLMLERMGWISP